MVIFMLQLVSDLILHKRFVFEEGRITLFNIPVSIIPTNFMVLLQKELEKEGLENLIYISVKNNGRDWFKSMDQNYGLKIKDIMKWGPELISLAGWGKVTVRTKKDSEKSLIVYLEKSSNAIEYGKSDKPVCNFFRGIVCGAWSYAYGEELEAIENYCVAKGDKMCEFIIMPKEKFDLSD